VTEYTLTSVQSHAELSVQRGNCKGNPTARKELPGKKANEILDFLKQL